MVSTDGAAGEVRGFRDALSTLRERQKTTKGAPAYSRYVNRRLGRVLAALAYTLGRTPNQVTALSAAFTFSGILTIALARPTILTSVASAACLVIGYALDAADGQLARLRGGGSVAGEWLDHVVDCIKIATLHLAVLIQWFRFSDRPDVELLIPLGFSAVASVMFFTIILNDQLRRAHRGSAEMLLQGEGTSSTLYSLAVVPTDYGLLCAVFLLQFWTVGFTWVYGALFLANAAFLVLALIKWFREMQTH
jgi:phosphatidylglycerophosphate synthase